MKSLILRETRKSSEKYKESRRIANKIVRNKKQNTLIESLQRLKRAKRQKKVLSGHEISDDSISTTDLQGQ